MSQSVPNTYGYICHCEVGDSRKKIFRNIKIFYNLLKILNFFFFLTNRQQGDLNAVLRF